MKTRSRVDIKPGTRVKVVQKNDQRSGELTEGIVKDILTRASNHPHGIKVRLENGIVGRVKEVSPIRSRLIWMIVVVGLLVGLSYIYMISAGHWSSIPDTSDNQYFDMLADAFLQGQTHLLKLPPEQLVKADNPWNPEYRELWIWDASLYKGKFYLYWGPVPALAAAAWKMVTAGAPVSDAKLVLFFALLRLGFGMLLVVRIVQTVFRHEPRLPAFLGLLVLGLGTPIPYMLGRPAVYEVSIMGGQAFMIGGLYFAFEAQIEQHRRRWVLTLLLLGGLSWGLAMGTRLLLVPAIALLALITILPWIVNLIRYNDHKQPVMLTTALLLPLAGCSLLYGIYNYVRFDSFLESGQRLQLTTITPSWSLDYIVPNLITYFFHPWKTLDQFPFIVAPWDHDWLPFSLSWPQGWHSYEPIIGLVITVPFLVFVIGTAYRLLKDFRRIAPVPHLDSAARNLLLVRWLGLCTAAMFLAPLAVLLVFFFTTMRYLGDLSTGAALHALFGLYGCLAWAASKRYCRIIIVVAALLLTFYTCVVGLLIWTESSNSFLRNNNPSLFDSLVTFFGALKN
jgi:uncharacterized repeat protein (TIGR03833 family)